VLSRAKILSAAAAVVWLGMPPAVAADGAWTFGTEDRDHPELRYVKDGKTVFYVGCGHAFGVHAVYPGPARKEGARVVLTIATTEARMPLAGEIESAHEDDPPGATHFAQWDLGFRRQDPALYGPRWRKLEERLLDLLDSGRALTISAEKGSYTLPAIDVPDWKKRFKKIC
jgi:hypothetical protein